MGAKQQAYKKLADTMIKNFSQRNIEAFYCDDRNQAVSLAMEMMKDGNTVGFGGSETLNEIGILDTIKNSSLTLIDLPPAVCGRRKERGRHLRIPQTHGADLRLRLPALRGSGDPG